MRADPFALKRHPRWHARRLAHKSLAVADEWRSRRGFDRYALPEQPWGYLPDPIGVDWSETSVTPEQMGHLLRALERTEHLAGTAVVEVGSYRGETTRCLASSTSRPVVAVDPFGGYGGAEEDFTRFRSKVVGLANVTHLRTTSGEAARGWSGPPIGLVFIDAVHDYANTAFDIAAWAPRIVPGGVLALHDVDQPAFAGTRRAAFELLGRLDLLAHPFNLAIFGVD